MEVKSGVSVPITNADSTTSPSDPSELRIHNISKVAKEFTDRLDALDRMSDRALE